MIKGHTEIQLYRDGKLVQDTHDDNMLTNALANYFKNYGQFSPNAFGDDIRNDLITTLLGGCSFARYSTVRAGITDTCPWWCLDGR